MKTNSPVKSAHCYLGFSPFVLGHAISKNILDKSKFFETDAVSTPIQHCFWSEFEITLLTGSKYREVFLEFDTPVSLNFAQKKIILGSGVETSLRELRRKFPRLEAKFNNAIFSKDDMALLEKNLNQIWLSVSKQSHIEAVDFNQILSNINNPLINTLIDWLTEALAGNELQLERSFINITGLIFLGTQIKELSRIQVFYLISKALCKNYFISSFAELICAFDLNKSISAPKVLQSEKVLVQKMDDKDRDDLHLGNFCVSTDGYFGTSYVDKIYVSGVSSDYQLFETKIDNYQVINVQVLKDDGVDNQLLVEMNGDEDILSIFFRDKAFIFSEEKVSSYRDFFIEDRDFDYRFYLLGSVAKNLYKLNHANVPPSAALELGINDRKYLIKALNDSHYIGNISSMFYGD